MIFLELFLSFLQIGLFSIGGGYAAMPLIEAQAVTEYGWLSMQEFMDLITIAEMTPGPIAVNSATFVGIRIAGLPGAIVATLGCILPSLFIVSLLSWIYTKYKNLSLLQSVLASLRPAVVALIASAGVKILIEVVVQEASYAGGGVLKAGINIVGTCLFLAAFYVLRKFKLNPILVMTLCGVVGLVAGVVLGI